MLDIPEPFEFSSFESCEKTFLSAHKEVYLALHPVFGLVLQVGDAGLKAWIPFYESANMLVFCLTAIKGDGSDQRLV